MYCTKCGTQMAASAHFCPGCGVAMSADTQTAAPPPRSRRSTALLIGGALVVITAVVVTVMLRRPPPPVGPDGITPEASVRDAPPGAAAGAAPAAPTMPVTPAFDWSGLSHEDLVKARNALDAAIAREEHSSSAGTAAQVSAE